MIASLSFIVFLNIPGVLRPTISWDIYINFPDYKNFPCSNATPQQGFLGLCRHSSDWLQAHSSPVAFIPITVNSLPLQYIASITGSLASLVSAWLAGKTPTVGGLSWSYRCFSVPEGSLVLDSQLEVPVTA